MSEEFKDENSPVSPSAEQDVVTLIKRMHQQLVFLEKKIDILIHQSQEVSLKERHFSKPYRSFDRSHRHDRGEHERSHEERGFGQGHNFEKRHGKESRGYDPRKKSYEHPRESNFSGERHFEKPHGGENRGFSPKKKPFYYGRKNRG